MVVADGWWWVDLGGGDFELRKGGGGESFSAFVGADRTKDVSCRLLSRSLIVGMSMNVRI